MKTSKIKQLSYEQAFHRAIFLLCCFLGMTVSVLINLVIYCNNIILIQVLMGIDVLVLTLIAIPLAYTSLD